MAWMEFEKVKSYEKPLSKKYEQELLLRIDRGENLSKGDLLRLVQCNCIEEATLDIDRMSFREDVRTISKLGDRYFAMKDFDDLYYMQPVKVQLDEKIVKIREWNEK